MKKLSMQELNRVNVEEFKQLDKTPIIVVLDNIRSMNNIGSIFRTCDAFRVEALFLCGITATPPNNEIRKTALGATESVDWIYYNSTQEAIEELKINNYTIYAIEQAENSHKLDSFKIPTNNKIAIIMGNEVEGVQQEIINQSNGCIEIPQFGTKHSFNVSVTTGIVLWEFFNQFKNNSF